MNRRTRTAAAITAAGATILTGALALGAYVVGATTSPGPAVTRTAATADVQVTYGGAIRCTNGVWSAITDAAHEPEGITSVTATSTYVQVNHVHVDKVLTAMYGWDNDYPMNGFYVTGASGGTDYDRFYFLKNGSRVDPATACDLAYTNVWVDGRGWVTTP